MATYSFGETSIADKIRRVRYVIAGISGLVLIAVSFQMLDRGSWLAAHVHLSNRTQIVAIIVPLVFLMNSFSNRKLWAGLIKSWLRKIRVETTPAGIDFYLGATHCRHVEQSKIVRAEEPAVGNGIYLRTDDRSVPALLPRGLEAFDDLKADLAARHIPIVKTVIPPDWYWYLYGLTFCSSLVWTLFCIASESTTNVHVANLVVALVVGVLGFFLAAADATYMPKASLNRLAAFLPLCCALFAFWI